MATLGIHKEFLLDFAKLEPPVRKRVSDLFEKFPTTINTGAHLEKINNAQNSRYRSVRIDNFWRGIVLAPKDGSDTYMLLKVLPHDDAYQWACRRQITVNTADHCIEIRDDDAMSEALPVIEKVAHDAPTRLLAHASDTDLRRLGVDEQTLRFARALTDAEQLDAAREYLPTTQWEVLYGLAAGYSPDEVWAHLGADALDEAPVDASDLDAAIARSRNRVVLVDGPEELMQVFADPFALWRIYLHPTQEALVKARFTGPARVSGGPGTGKTVVALHRAHELAKRGAGPVLVTTFTANLAASMADNFEMLVDSEGVRNLIAFTHIDKLANQVVSELHGHLRILASEREAEMWELISQRLDIGLSAAFLADEWRHVVLAKQSTSLDDYLTASRAGRGKRLGPRQKERAWAAIAAFEKQLRDDDLWTHETVAREAARILNERNDKPYRHIIVDEAQDLNPDQWRMLRAAITEADDDIFLAGDTHQRIYDCRVSLREVGINIAGRSRRLPINYRTTAETLGWSLAILRNESIDDMMDGLDSIAGCRSDVHGQAPTSIGCRNTSQEVATIVETVRKWIDEGVSVEDIGIAVRAKWYGSKIEHGLRKAGVKAELLGKSRHLEGVAVATMHRMKGLEFRCLIAAGINANQVPQSAAVTTVEEDEHKHGLDLQRERCLLFVACTRAREQLVVTWHGTPSPFLQIA
ncbi:UvrD-helicase domain-containing protein [Nocardia sp. NPDC049220]|uniref:UvrD-helicase domain-containing protein n=1 Tax=Nocardia sp. NPDC049220 TaxID=3155273 RepID=UPI0034029B7E